MAERSSLSDLLGRIARAQRGRCAGDPCGKRAAQLHAIHAGAGPSGAGQGNSWGVMVNYLYDLGRIEANHQAYANEGMIAVATKPRQLARK